MGLMGGEGLGVILGEPTHIEAQGRGLDALRMGKGSPSEGQGTVKAFLFATPASPSPALPLACSWERSG